MTRGYPGFPVILIAKTQSAGGIPVIGATFNAHLFQEARYVGQSLIVLHRFTRFMAVNVVPVTDPLVAFSVFSKSSRHFPAYEDGHVM